MSCYADLYSRCWTGRVIVKFEDESSSASFFSFKKRLWPNFFLLYSYLLALVLLVLLSPLSSIFELNVSENQGKRKPFNKSLSARNNKLCCNYSEIYYGTERPELYNDSELEKLSRTLSKN